MTSRSLFLNDRAISPGHVQVNIWYIEYMDHGPFFPFFFPRPMSALAGYDMLMVLIS